MNAAPPWVAMADILSGGLRRRYAESAKFVVGGAHLNWRGSAVILPIEPCRRLRATSCLRLTGACFVSPAGLATMAHSARWHSADQTVTFRIICGICIALRGERIEPPPEHGWQQRILFH